MRRTKILATLGPSTNNLDTLRQMVQAGVNAVRVNFSHGTLDDKRKLVAMVRQAAQEAGKVVGILGDLQGPKIRIAKFKQGKVFLADGAEFVLDAALAKDAGDEKTVGIDYKELPRDVKPGDILLLDDGRIEFVVKNVVGEKIICTVKAGGDLSNNKGINRQGGGLSAKALTDKDREDIKSAAELNVDYMAVSFVRSAEDMHEARQLLTAAGGSAGIIAKIERLEAVIPEVLDEIIKASDGVMVARGDLAVEIGDAEVPAAQKHIIERTRALNKPVITATQMLETMVHNVVPTRAEVSDVANAVLDGTDTVMLSEETAAGEHPVLVIQTMARLCAAAEKHPATISSSYRVDWRFERIDEAVSMATMYAANHLNIAAIISLTETGMTALWMSRIRSGIPIYGMARHPHALGKMSLYSDVCPIEFDVTACASNTDVKIASINELKKRGLVKEGDLVIITSGENIGVSGGTNSLTILTV